MNSPSQLDSRFESEPTRKERERRRHRAEILAAAQGLFSIRGFHNVSMQEVAARSEFSIGTLYGFFKSKDELYAALVLDLADQLHRELADAMDMPVGWMERLHAFLTTKIRLITTHGHLLRLYQLEAGGLNPNARLDLKQALCGRHSQTIQKLRQIFADGRAGGHLKPNADPALLALALEYLSTAVLMEHYDADLRAALPRDPDTIINLLLDGWRA
jgi:TetR/AcrR family transcriptional regulator